MVTQESFKEVSEIHAFSAKIIFFWTESSPHLGKYAVSDYGLPNPTLKLGLAHNSALPLAAIKRSAAEE